MESLSEAECKEALRRDKLNLYPLQACNLQILALVSFWIASKIHETKAVSLEQLRKLASSLIADQHFTKNDFIEAEIILMKGIKFDLTTGPQIFYAMDDLLVKFRKTARVGRFVKLQTCVTIIDLLYDFDPKELNLKDISIDEISSAILAVAYVLSVPIEKCNFPLLSWLSSISGSQIQQSQIEDLTRKIFCGLFDEMMDNKERHPAIIEDIPCVSMTFDPDASCHQGLTLGESD
ncbi:unnamed protein product [Calypogeia fissa]